MLKKVFYFVTSSIKRKLIVSTAFIIMFCVLVIGHFTNIEVSTTIKNDVEKYSVQILNQANLNLNRYFQEYEQGFLLAGTSREFEEWLKVPNGQVADMVNAYRPLETNYFRSLALRHPEILSISVLNSNGNEMHYTNFLGLDKDYSVKPEVEAYAKLTTQRIQVSFEKTNRYVDISGNHLDITVVSIVKNFLDRQGYIKIDISLQPTINILNEINMGKGGGVLLADSSGNIITSNGTMSIIKLDEDIVKNINSETYGSFFNNKGNLIVFDTLPYTGWKTIAIMPNETVSQSIFKISRVIIVIAVVSLVISIIFVIIITSSITNRVINLRSLLKDIPKGKLNTIEGIKGNDEVTALGKAYNNMVVNLNETIDKLAEASISQQRAVLSVLQSQINSHFLYNTLESINSMASLAEQHEIEKVTIALSKMLRYTANYKEAKVTIQQEVNHLKNYMEIMKTRYGDVISYNIKLEDDCKDIPCLKVILQPLVENSIKHGIEVNGKSVHVEVKVECLTSTIVKITIMDNGTGFDESILKELREKMKLKEEQSDYSKFSHIGLLNVNYRLKMFYKKNEAGIFMGNRTDNSGAMIQIIFPKTL
jgi:two-component system, sensor histidine kinase YesM